MYYFKLLELLTEKKGEEYTSRELFFILSKKEIVNILAVKNVLTKMYMKNKHVERKWIVRTDRYGKTWREYVYFYSD
jgi:hypothetical protein